MRISKRYYLDGWDLHLHPLQFREVYSLGYICFRPVATVIRASIFPLCAFLQPFQDSPFGNPYARFSCKEIHCWLGNSCSLGILANVSWCFLYFFAEFHLSNNFYIFFQIYILEETYSPQVEQWLVKYRAEWGLVSEIICTCPIDTWVSEIL